MLQNFLPQEVLKSVRKLKKEVFLFKKKNKNKTSNIGIVDKESVKMI